MKKLHQSESARIVSGHACRLVQMRLRLHIVRLALRHYRNPLLAIKAMQALVQKKHAILGETGIPKLVKSGAKYYWSVTSAGWPSLAFDNFITGELNKVKPIPQAKNPLQTIIFSITSRCPLKCEHCYEWDKLSSQESLSLQQLQLSLQEFQDYGVCNIQLSGGEPLSRFEDLLSLLKTSRRSSEFWILSSGFGLTQGKALKLKQAGLTGVIISLDSWNEEQHNLFRANSQAFKWALEAATNAGSSGLVVAFSLCAARDFVSPVNLEKYLQLAQRYGAAFVRILEPRKVGHFAGQDVELNKEQLDVLARFYLDSHTAANRNYPIIEYVGYHQRLFGCFGAGDRYLYVDSTGEIHACPFCQNPLPITAPESVEQAIARLRKTGCHKFTTKLPEGEIAGA